MAQKERFDSPVSLSAANSSFTVSCSPVAKNTRKAQQVSVCMTVSVSVCVLCVCTFLPAAL